MTNEEYKIKKAEITLDLRCCKLACGLLKEIERNGKLDFLKSLHRLLKHKGWLITFSKKRINKNKLYIKEYNILVDNLINIFESKRKIEIIDNTDKVQIKNIINQMRVIIPKCEEV